MGLDNEPEITYCVDCVNALDKQKRPAWWKCRKAPRKRKGSDLLKPAETTYEYCESIRKYDHDNKLICPDFGAS